MRCSKTPARAERLLMDALGQSRFSPVFKRAENRLSATSGEESTEKEENSPDGFEEGPLPGDELDHDEEREEGDRHESELLGKHRLWEDEESAERLEQVYESLLPFMLRDEIPYEFLALDSDIPFASSCPNGVIFFTRSFLQRLRPEEVRFFAAHELAHTELRHYASRKRRLADLRLLIPAPIGSPTRHRLDLASVLVVRHQEEFEADFRAGEWLDFELGTRALNTLQQACRRLAPHSLQRPTHPRFEQRMLALEQKIPFSTPVEYLYSLMQKGQ